MYDKDHSSLLCNIFNLSRTLPKIMMHKSEIVTQTKMSLEFQKIWSKSEITNYAEARQKSSQHKRKEWQRKCFQKFAKLENSQNSLLTLTSPLLCYLTLDVLCHLSTTCSLFDPSLPSTCFKSSPSMLWTCSIKTCLQHKSKRLPCVTESMMLITT